MKFSDIDFSAISRMMDSMSDEQKEKLNDMAQGMMDTMKTNTEETEEVDFYTYLQIDEEEYMDLPGNVLDPVEAACDLEQYYEEVPESDFSASILFLAKAVLNMSGSSLLTLPSNITVMPEACTQEAVLIRSRSILSRS